MTMSEVSKAGSMAFPRGKRNKDKTEKTDGEISKKAKIQEEDLFKNAEIAIKKEKNKKKKNKKENKDEKGFGGLKVTSVEPLNYRVLSEGMLVMGVVASVGEYEVKVSLPGHLVGVVPITNVSRPYTKAITKIASDPGAAETAEIGALRDMFSVGQAAVCSVVKVEEDPDKHFFKVTLSLAPQDAQSNLTAAAVKKGAVVQAAVASVEDHGFIMDVGVAGVRAFLPHKKAEKYVEELLGGRAPTVGQVLPCLVTKSETGSASLTCDPIKLRKAVQDEKDVSVHTMTPGMTLRARVKQEMKGGVRVTFGDFSGYVYRDHFAGELEVDETVEARILYVVPTVNTIMLTCKDHVKFGKKFEDPLESIAVGDNIKEAEVLDSSQKGIVLKLDDEHIGFVSPKHIHDSAKTAKHIKEKFAAGTKKPCRVIQYDYADAMFICTMQKSLLNQKVLQASQLKPGDKVSCVVKAFLKSGVEVEINNKAKAFIPSMHLSDVPLKHPEKKYPPGTKLNCKVLRTDPEKKKIHLTNKSILVKEEFQVISDYDPSQIGTVTEGVVVKVKNEGLLLALFGDVAGWVPKSKMSTEPIEYPEKLFFMGQVLKCQILNMDPENRLMTLSLIIGGHHKPLGSKEKRAGDKIKLGQFYEAKVVQKTVDGLEVETEGVKAFVPKHHLTDDVMRAESLLDRYSVGDEIKEALCYERDVVPILTLKPAIVKAAKSETLPETYDDLQVDVKLPAVICLIKSYGVFLRLPTWKFRKSALVPVRYLSDSFVEDINEHVTLHQTVMAKVIERNENEQKITMTMKPSEAGELVLDKAEPAKDEKALEKSRKRKEKKEKKKAAKRAAKEEADAEVKEEDEAQEEAVEVKRPRLMSGSSDVPDPGWEEEFDPWANKEEVKEESDDEESEGKKKVKTHISKKEKKELDRLEAEEIARAEQRVLDGEEAEPETEEEFDRLVLSSPNSSLCWIKYMAFFMDKKEYEKARKVAKKALEKINFREDEEKYNVYMAWLNLENSFGDDESTENLLAKALKYCDQYKIYAQMANVYELSEKREKAEKLYKTMARKFCKEPEAWVKLGTHYFKNGDLAEARFTLQRAIQNLEKKLHVAVTSTFAQLEFKLGEKERGKTVFETILGNYPRRADLWSVYVDMLIKARDFEAARGVFERMILLGLPPKKMKFFFKKYLAFEEQHGDQQGADKVRKKALEYVESKVGQVESMDTDE